ncbi:MAG: hydroxyacid dehydrogenase [Pyrinomonadaceae bacterium]|nr:hydroxyacid dehydrogenase [Pyrinomonadaceae bacterium]
MKILLLEPVHEDARRMLDEAGEVAQAEAVDGDYLRLAIADAAAAMTRGYGRLPREVLVAGRNLRCVARCGVGTDNIDVAAATELGLPVIYAPGSTTIAVAEHTMMLILAVARRVIRFDREVKAGNWKFRGEAGLSTELGGKTLGVLGLGDIGQRVAELGQAFGMRVCYWSRGSRDERFQFLDREELLRSADVLSVNVALTPDTRKFLDQKSLALMKPSAIIVNTARGDVIDETALYDALASGRLAGAGLDVIAADSPHETNPLWTLDNVVVTPHVAAVADVAFRRMCVETAEQVIRILRGQQPDARLVRNPTVLTK